MNCPHKSTDLNPIEHPCCALEEGIKARYTTLETLTELGTDLADVWQAMPVEHFCKLMAFMPRRVVAFIKTRGDLTRF